MSKDARPIIDVLDSLLTTYLDMSQKEVKGCELSELKQDLVSFRDTLTELGAIIFRYGMDLIINNPKSIDGFKQIITSIMGNSIMQSNQTINTGIMMVELTQGVQDPIKDSKLIATFVNTGLSSNGLIVGLKALKEFVKKL